jgi:small-conductance mechanosensitive channel
MNMSIDILKIYYPIFIAIALFIILLIFRKILFAYLHRWAEKSATKIDDFILKHIRLPSFILCFIFPIFFLLATVELPQKLMEYSEKTILTLVILCITFALAGLCTIFIEKRAIQIPVTGIATSTIKIVIFILGILMILHTLGISITPVITALGVGGLAVALALQDTLSNLFAGFYLLIDKPVKVGDYIRLSSGEEGYVIDIGWRSTKIRMLSNNIIIIPNSTLSQATITNFHLFEPKMSIYISIGVSYDSDPEKVEQILIDIVHKARDEIHGISKEDEPLVRFRDFGDSSLNFTLICRVKEYGERFRIEHELRKRIFARFQEEGIEIPFPIRTVYLKEGTSVIDK